jgi:mono/diheme cytochrome c family protein
MFRSAYSRLAFLGILASLLLGTVVAWPSAQAVHTELIAVIYAGVCADHEVEPVFELTGPTYGEPIFSGEAVASPEAFRITGSSEGLPVVASTTVIPASMDDLIDAAHVVVVRIVETESGTDVRLACGALGGVRTNGDLVFGLRSEAARTTGIVWLRDNGDETTTVTLFIAQGLLPADEITAGTPLPDAIIETPIVEATPEQEVALEGDVTRGQQLSAQCIACHTTDGSVGVGPTWQGLYGKTETLEGGETVVVDDAYLHESIVDPGAKIVAGYPNVMPPYAHLSDEEIADLIAYIKSLQ